MKIQLIKVIFFVFSLLEIRSVCSLSCYTCSRCTKIQTNKQIATCIGPENKCFVGIRADTSIDQGCTSQNFYDLFSSYRGLSTCNLYSNCNLDNFSNQNTTPDNLSNNSNKKYFNSFLFLFIFNFIFYKN